MNKKEEDQSLHSSSMDHWLQQFFLDPFTTYLDDIMFRIDIYENSTSYIVEALLPHVQKNEISIHLKDKTLLIRAHFHSDSKSDTFRYRKVDFPFDIVEKKITAKLEHDILEIVISKKEPGNGENRVLSLSD